MEIDLRKELIIGNINLNLLSENPLVYTSSPLCVLRGDLNTDTLLNVSARMLLDCGASTNYVSKEYCKRLQIPTQRYPNHQIQVKLGDNQNVSSELEVAKVQVRVTADFNWYDTTMVVYQIPDEFDIILGMPFFEEVDPNINWKTRTIHPKLDKGKDGNLTSSIEEGSPVYNSKLPVLPKMLMPCVR